MAAESKLERECRDYVEVCYSGKLTKVRSIGDNGFPDRIVFIPRCPPIFCEFKSSVGVLGKRQEWWMKWLINSGFYWYLANDFYDFCKVIDEHARRHGECGT